MRFNCIKARATSSRWLLFTTKFPEVPGTHFIDLGRMKDWIDLGTTQLFLTRDWESVLGLGLNTGLEIQILNRYVNRHAVVLATHCQSYIAFWLDVRCLKWLRSFFCSCFSPMIVHLHKLILLIAPVVRMLLNPRWVSRWKDVKWSYTNVAKLIVGDKDSISRRTTVLLIST